MDTPIPQGAKHKTMIERRVPSWLLSGGLRSWLVLGIGLVVVGGYLAVGAASSLVAPLVVAGVLGVLFSPVVVWLTHHHVPKIVAVITVIVGLAIVIAFTMEVTISGVIDQAPEIEQQVKDGSADLVKALNDAGITTPSKSDVTKQAQEAGSKLAGGAVSNLDSLFASISSFLFGLFILTFLLYYALSDWDKFESWAARRMGVPEAIGSGIVANATSSIRIYFGGLTISSIMVAIIIGGTMWALNIPLAFTVAVVTFVTAYIPYLGAIISGAFAFLVTLGAAGMTTALIVLAVVLVAQNVIQAVMQTKLTSESLEVHPALNFASTILGAIIAGAIGAILAAPLVSTAIRTMQVLGDYYKAREAGLDIVSMTDGAPGE